MGTKQAETKTVVISRKAWDAASEERIRRRRDGLSMSVGAIISELLLKTYPTPQENENPE